MHPAIARFSDRSLGYGGDLAVHHLNDYARQGSLTSVVEANGSGKTILIKGIAGILSSLTQRWPQQSKVDRSLPARAIDLLSLDLGPRRGSPWGRGQGAREVGQHALSARFLSSVSWLSWPVHFIVLRLPVITRPRASRTTA